jgi:hypothetical protein
MDPVSFIALGAAIGGASGKFVEKAWDSGEKWIQSYFKDHRENAQKQATENSKDFLNELALRVKQLEDQNTVSKEEIDQAQDHPDFSAFLQKALLTSAQTDSKDKHKLLARLVSERLTSEPESVFSLASKMACDAISFATNNQIILLGLVTNLFSIRPSPFPPKGLEPEQFQDWLDNWLTRRLNPFRNLTIGKQDLRHLESLSCLKINQLVGRELNNLYSVGEFKFDFNLLKDNEFKEKIKLLWDSSKLQTIDLTTTGQIIGVMVSDMFSNNTKTDFNGWE